MTKDKQPAILKATKNEPYPFLVYLSLDSKQHKLTARNFLDKTHNWFVSELIIQVQDVKLLQQVKQILSNPLLKDRLMKVAIAVDGEPNRYFVAQKTDVKVPGIDDGYAGFIYLYGAVPRKTSPETWKSLEGSLKALYQSENFLILDTNTGITKDNHI